VFGNLLVGPLIERAPLARLPIVLVLRALGLWEPLGQADCERPPLAAALFARKAHSSNRHADNWIAS
jgi:hypothetical protein